MTHSFNTLVVFIALTLAVWCVCSFKNLLDGKKTSSICHGPIIFLLTSSVFFFNIWKVEPLALVFHCSGTQSCMSLCTVAFSLLLQGDLKTLPRFVGVQQFFHCVGVFLALRQSRWCGITPDSSLLVHEGFESSTWVVYAWWQYLMSSVYAGSRPCCIH